MKIDQRNKTQVIGFSVFAGILLILFVYAGSTGWRLWSSDGSQQKWNSSGPGYHK